MLSHGIVLYNNSPSILTLDLRISTGFGDIYVDGLVTEEFETIYQRSFSAVCDLVDLGEIPEPDFAGLDIHFCFSHSIPDVPITGDSYGLLLGLSLALAFNNMELNPKLCVTGALGEDARVLPVGGISEKRKGALALGFENIMLPQSQLDFFSKDVGQIPVESLYEAWAIANY